MAAPTEPTELRSRVESALRRIASPSQPQSIQQAQDALLRWEEARADAYAVALASLIGATSSASDADAAAEDPAASAATLRLAAVLALKAAATRRWKDRGRGRAGAPKVLFGEGVKTLIRQTVLNLVLAGKVMDGETGFVNGPDEVTREQAELIQDRALQANAASLVSKIARMDLPLKWQELIPSLVEGVRRAQTTIHQMKQQQAPSREMQHLFQTLLYNTMNALEAVLSEISTQRLLVDKKYRHSVALQHLGSVVENGLIPSYQDMESFRNMGNNIGTEEDVGTLAVKYATVTARVVSHMMLSAFSKLVEDNAALVAKTLEMIHSLIHSFLSVWLRFILDGRHDKGMIDEPMEELLQVHCELIVNTQRSHPVAFVGYLPPFLHLFHSSLMGIAGVPGEETNQGASNADVRCSDRLAVAFLSFLANVVGTSRYEEMEGAKNTLAGFFAPTLVATLSRTLLRLFSLHIRPTRSRNGDDDVDDADDAVLWQDDPEAFYHWELHRSSDEDVGCAAQNLFLALVESSFSGGIILPWLMDLLKYAESQRLAAELDTRMFTGTDAQLVLSALPLGISSAELSRGSRDVAMDLLLQWDSIYTAAGLAGSMLDKCPGFDFRSWFNTSLGDCLALLLRRDKQGQTRLPILERRIIWLFSCNAHQVEVTSPLNPLGMLVSAISAPDVCVRLTAVQAVDALIPHCEVTPSLLHSIVGPTVPALYRLVNDCEEVDSRSSCLDLLSNLVCMQAPGSLSNEVLNAIVAPLSSIWENATDQNLLLRRNVLAILSCVASSVGPEGCAVLYPLALPIVDQSFANEENAFLVGPAIQIWWVFLRLSRSYDPLLGKLFVHAGVLSKDFEHLMVLMRVTEHYIMLGGATFLNDHAGTVQMVLSNLIGEVNPRGTAYVFLVVEALLRCFPAEGGALLQSCGACNALLLACGSSFFEEEKCEPDRAIVLYLTSLARVVLSAPEALQLPLTLPSGAVFGEGELVSLYLRKFQVAGNGAHGLLFQKLWALLLLSFYPPCRSPRSDAVLRESNAIFNIFTVLLKNVSKDGTNVLSYEIGYDDEEEPCHIGEDFYESLLQEQRTKDLVISTSLREALSTKLRSIPNEVFSHVETDTLRQLEEVLGAPQS